MAMSVETETERLSRLEGALARLTVRLREVSYLDEVGDVVEAAVREATGASHVIVRILERDGGLRLLHGGPVDESVAAVLRLEVADRDVQSLLRDGVPIWNVPAGEVARRLVHGGDMPPLGIPADTHVCTLSLNAVAAAVGTLSALRAVPFDSEERWFLFAVAGQASQVIERLDALGRERAARVEVEDARSRLEFLSQMTSALLPLIEGGCDDPAVIFRAFCDLASPQIGDACFVRIVESDRLEPVAMSGPEELVGPLRSILSHRRFPAVFEPLSRGEVVILSDVGPPVVTAIAGHRYAEGTVSILSRVRSIAHVPVVCEGRLAAAVSIVSGREISNRIYNRETDRNFFQEIGTRLSMFAGNVAEFQRGRRVTETFQRMLLPESLPSVPGFEAAARYVPSSDGDDVGGDWFEMVELPDGRVVAAIGDVVGSGIEAAAAMGEFRTCLRALALEGLAPGRLLERLSEFALGLGRGYATAFVCAIDPRRGEIRFSSAGHPPAFLVRSTGDVEALEGASALPLAVESGIAYPEGSRPISPGDTLFLFTDGLVERRGESLDRGLESLRVLLRRPQAAVDGLVTSILSQASDAAGRSDDIAVLAVRLLARVRRFELRFPAEPASVARFRAGFRSWLEERGVAALDTEELVLAVSEATSNAIEHAGRPELPVVLTAELRGEELVLAVRDHGRWRPPSVRPERGRGMSILRGVTDSIEVHRRSGGTEVRMRRRLGVR